MDSRRAEQRCQQRAAVQRALSAAADFLTSYLSLANAHPVDFIVQDAWNQVLPPRIQSELLALSEQQLSQLPSGCVCPDPCFACDKSKKEVTESCTPPSVAGKEVTESCNPPSVAGKEVRESCNPPSVAGEEVTETCNPPSVAWKEVTENCNPPLSVPGKEVTESCNPPSVAGKRIDSHSQLHADRLKAAQANCERLQDSCKESQDTNTDEVELNNGIRLEKGTELNDESKCVVWKHGSLREFLTGVREHCVDRLLSLDESMTSLSAWLNSELTEGQGAGRTLSFVHSYMTEKKMHEVEIMGDLCARIFDRSSADVVVDVGSGKGYLSTHLSLQHELSVIGVDSQPHNTAGAVQRSAKLQRRWDSLLKQKQKKLLKDNVQRQEIRQGTAEKGILSADISSAAGKGQCGSCHSRSPAGDDADACRLTTNDDHSLQTNSEGWTNLSESRKQGSYSESKPCQKSNICDTTIPKMESCSDSKSHPKSNTQGENQNTSLESILILSDKNDRGRSELLQTEDSETKTENKTDQSKTTFRHVAVGDDQADRSPKAESSKHVAVTMFVDPDTRLTELVGDSVSALCPGEKAAGGDVRLLLTGLHTCGPLGSSMLRLFVKDGTVRAMCGVGCCYQLMQETFLGDSGEWQPGPGPHGRQADSGISAQEAGGQRTGDFPLSSILLERRMSIGRTALNTASLALPRMTQSSGQLQGKTYYPRALLQAFIHSKLGYIPQDLKKLRKLAKQASDPADYVRRAIHKWNISGCEATDEEIDQFHAEHLAVESQMAAFFQLRAALAPVVETVVLLDRLMYLFEQDCVENAFLVRLFDPVTSPRCHAMVAFKEEHSHHL